MFTYKILCRISTREKQLKDIENGTTMIRSFFFQDEQTKIFIAQTWTKEYYLFFLFTKIYTCWCNLAKTFQLAMKLKWKIKIISFRSTNVTYTLQPTSFHFHQLAESYIIFPRKSFEKNQRLWDRSDMAINDFDSRGSDIQRVSPEGVE